MPRLLTLSVALLCGLALSGCPKEEATKAAPTEAAPAAAPAEAPSTASPAAGTEANEIWTGICAECHGEAGLADTETAEDLDPTPRSFADVEWQREVTDDHIAQVILGGGGAVGKSDDMPSHPELKDKKEVLDALVEKVRAFGPR